MKNTILITLLCGIWSVNVSASDYVDDGFWFPNETFDYVESVNTTVATADININQVESITTAGEAVFVADNQRRFRRNFLSRRPYLAPINNSNPPEQYAANEGWQGATKLSDQPFEEGVENLNTDRKSNIKFFSRRAYMKK